MVESVKSQRLWILKILLTIQLGYLAFLFIDATQDGRYFLFNEDEVINYCSGQLFAQTGSVRAGVCIAEDVSRIGQMNWYGPGYSFFYGSMNYLFGDAPHRFVQIHFLFSIASIFIIFFFRTPLENRLLSASAVAFTQAFTNSIFTYFPEALHIFFATVVIFFLWNIDRSTGGIRKRWISGFIFMVILFSIFRITHIFWLTGLLGLSDTRKRLVQSLLILAIGAIIVLVYMKFFTAPPYAGEMHKIDKLYSIDLLGFIFSTAAAMARNSFALIQTGYFGVYFLLGIGALAIFQYWRTRERFLLAAVIISGSFLAALMAFYSAHPWYFLKQSAVMIPLLILALMLSRMQQRLKYGMVGISLLWFLTSYVELQNVIQDRRNAYVNLEAQRALVTDMKSIPDFIKSEKEITIVWSYTEYDFGSTTEAILPFATRAGKPILYTTNIVSPNDPPEIRFHLHHKIPVDYVLSRKSIDLAGTREVHATSSWHLYEIIGQEQE